MREDEKKREELKAWRQNFINDPKSLHKVNKKSPIIVHLGTYILPKAKQNYKRV